MVSCKNHVNCFHSTELMLLGFISLLLTVFQNAISKFCVPPDLMTHLLPCSLSEESGSESSSSEEASHFQSSFSVSSSISGTVRRLLAETTTATSETGTCAKKVLLIPLYFYSWFIFFWGGGGANLPCSTHVTEACMVCSGIMDLNNINSSSNKHLFPCLLFTCYNLFN